MFYLYDQNNSGGFFQSDDKVCQNVIIEADDEREADYIAIGLGIYFDGVVNGRDCDCCGDRWSSMYGWGYAQGTEVPTIYGQSVEDGVYSDKYGIGWTTPYAYIHYKDGRVEAVEYRKEEENDNT